MVSRGVIKSTLIIMSIFICSLFMTSNASAFDITTPVEPTGRSWTNDAYWWTTFNPDTGGYYTSTAYSSAIFINKNSAPNKQVGGNYILNAIQVPNIDVKYGYYYSININFTYQNMSTQEAYPSIIKIQPAQAFSLMAVVSDWTPCGAFTPTINNQAYDPSVYSGLCSWGGVSYNIIVQAKDTGNIPLMLGLTNTDMFRFRISEQNTTSNLNVGTISISEVKEFKTINQQDQTSQILINEQQQNEQQGQQSQNDSNTSGQQVEGATTNVLGVLTGFIGAFISAQATNCNFATGTFLGVIDMCSTSIPPAFNVILSLVSILVIVPMAIWLFNSIINAFKEFQE